MIDATISRLRLRGRARRSAHGRCDDVRRGAVRLPQQVRAGRGDGPHRARPAALHLDELSRGLRVRRGDARRGRRPARRAVPGGRADLPRLPDPGARRRRLPHDRRQGAGREDPLRPAQGSRLDARPRRPRHPARAAQRDRALLPGLQGPRGGEGGDARLREPRRGRGDRRTDGRDASSPGRALSSARADDVADAGSEPLAAATAPQETRGARRSSKPMATRKKRAAPARPRKPRSPARVRKKKKQARGHQHPELWGLGLVAVGLVLATVLWLGWDGGPVGSHVSRVARATASARRAPLVPLALLAIGRADARAERARRPPAVPHRSRRRAASG